MKRVAWMLGALLGAVVVLLAVRTLLGPDLGPIEATPVGGSVSVNVGDTLTFVGESEGAVAYSWSVWDREVSRERSWVFAPGPEEVGWQQVTLVVTGARGARRERAWNVGVMIPVAPELTETVPDPGWMSTKAGSQVTFRCSARVPAAREVDRLRFEWTLDGTPILHEEQPAAGGMSQVVVAPEAGVHRLAVHVREVDRISSFAEWTLDVAAAPVAEMAEKPVKRAESESSPVDGAEPEPPLIARVEPAPPTLPAVKTTVPPVAEPSTSVPSPTIPRPTTPPPSTPLSTTSPPTTAPPPGPPPPPLPTTPPPTVPPPPTPRTTVPRPTIPPPTTPPSTVLQPTIPPPTIPPPTTPPPTVPPSTIPRAATPPSTAPPAVPPSTAPVVVARAVPPEAPAPPTRLVRDPKGVELAVPTGSGLILHARVEPPRGPTRYRWTVDGRMVKEEEGGRFDYLPIEPGRHQVSVSARVGEREVGSGTWLVVARAPVEPRPPRIPEPAAAPPPPAVAPPSAQGPPAVVEASRKGAELDESPAASAPHQLREEEIRSWLQEYAAAWSRKDVEALRRMGQVRSGGEVERLERYFKSIDDLRVAVRVLTLRVEGERAAVEFERTDTVTDPAGQRRELRLPPIRKQIERTPQGLRFADGAGAG